MPATTNFTDLDYTSLRARLVALAQSVFPDVDWTAAASLEVLLLELNAYVGDIIAYYLNKVGREARWGTATQRRSLLTLIKLIGYKAPGAIAATYLETFALAAPAAAPMLFQAGTVVLTSSTTGAQSYQLLADITILAGQSTGLGIVENSSPELDSFASGGLVSQAFVLTQTPYLDKSATVTAADGTYVEVDNFLASKATDRHFTTSVDDLDRCTVTFGTGTSGSIPSGTITVNYKTGGGAAGNVVAGAINRIPGNFADTNGNPVRVTVTNAAGPVTVGVDRASAAQIRALAPQSLRVLGRAVAREDYELIAVEVPGVARALCLTSNEEAGVAENSAIVFLVPTGGGTASSALCASVLAQFVGPTAPVPTINTLRLLAQTAAYLTVSVGCKIYVRKGFAPAAVAVDIRQRFTDFFATAITPSRLWQLAPTTAQAMGLSASDTSSIQNPLVNFGYELQDVDGNPIGSFGWSDMFDLLAETSGVLRVAPDAAGFTLNGARDNVAIFNFQFPVLITVGITNATDGTVL